MVSESKSYNEEIKRELLFKYSSEGDYDRVKHSVEVDGIDVNTTKFKITALSVCAAESGNTKVMEYLLSKGAKIGDSFFYAIRAGNVECFQFLLTKLSKSEERLPIKKSLIFPPYMTPMMLASICGHRTLIELLMMRGHTIPAPHLADCECDDCNVSTTNVSTHSQRNLDVYRALCNPEYIGLYAKDPIQKAFELETQCSSVIKNTTYFSHHFNDLFIKMEQFVKDIFDVTRDAEEVKILVEQKADTTQRNIFIKYVVLQKAVDNRWLDFIASKRIESLRSHLWLGHNKLWLQTGIVGLCKRLVTSILVIVGQPVMALALVARYRKHNSAQYRYICRIFNETLFVFALLYYLNSIVTNNKNNQKWPKVLIILWTFGNIVNIFKKWAVFGPQKLLQFYGHTLELFITLHLLVIIYLTFKCDDKKTNQPSKKIQPNNQNTKDMVSGPAPDLETSFCSELNYVIMNILVKVIHIRLLMLASLRAYKGLETQLILRQFLFAFLLISIFFPLFSDTITKQYKFSSFESTLGLKMFGNWGPTYVLIAINFLIGLSFEILSGPEKISDKTWCFHWTARLIYEIHGACELAVPFNILETHNVIHYWLKRVGLKEPVSEKDVKKYQEIKDQVYSRYECAKYLDSNPNRKKNINFRLNAYQ